MTVRHDWGRFGLLIGLLMMHRPSSAQTQSRYLGPESAVTVEVRQPRLLYSIGEADGPNMIDQGEALAMAPGATGELLIYTAYFSDGPIRVHRGGRVEREFGRRGDGPGEYQQIHSLGVDCLTGNYWAVDRMRMVSFSRRGEAGPVLWIDHAGLWAQEFLFLPDGSLLLVGPGGKTDNLGFLLHRYDFLTDSWSSHYPLFRDSLFVPTRDLRKWLRKLAIAADGRVLAITDEYLIEVFDPGRDFALLETVRRRPSGWPEDVTQDYRDRSRKHRLARPFMVVDAWVDGGGKLWVVSVMPEDSWQEDLGRDPRRPGEETFVSDDHGFDSLVEVIDPSTWTVLGSYSIDPMVRAIVGPGEVAYYDGDLPFPRINVVKILD